MFKVLGGNNMLIEECQVDFDIRQYKCENCQQDFYCYRKNNICPHCEHENSEKAMAEGIIITEVIIVGLNWKTMEFEAY
jgi:Zn finger protein HypA/HybF involved in hydrogenase expression